MPLLLYRNHHYRNGRYDTANVRRKCDSCMHAVLFMKIDVHAHLPRILHDEWLRATAVRKKCVNLQAC